jgi:hypothetical protein
VVLASNSILVVCVVQEGIHALVDVGHGELEHTGVGEANRHGVTLAVNILLSRVENFILILVEGLGSSDASAAKDIGDRLKDDSIMSIMII